MKDRETGKPRGFGFVTFETEEAVDNVLSNLKEHKLMDKWVECKKATPKALPLLNKAVSDRAPNKVSIIKYDLL